MICRLVLETNDGVEDIDFPGGGGVASGGFGGVVRTSTSSEFVPNGLSVWELSVQDGANAKADDDYQKRTHTPDGSATTDCAYVQVISRPWVDRREWATARTAEGRWQQVRAYNVDTLEAWLGQAPATTAWFAHRIGEPTHGIVAVSDWWDAWQAATEPPMTAEVVLGGRVEQVDLLRRRLAGNPTIISVGGDLRVDELRAFVAAAVAAPGTPVSLEARALFVDDQTSFHRLLRHPTPTVLIIPDPAWLSVDTGRHYVVVAVPGAHSADVVVPPVGRGDVTDALQVAGVDRREAEELGELARRSLLALRRRLARRPELHRPGWAGPGADRIRRRLLLVDRWHEGWEGDRDAVAQIVGEEYPTVDDELTGLAATPDDPMVAIVDGVWHVVSPKDAWLLLGGQLTRTDLEAFRALAVAVLTERDPSFDLPEDERWLAAVRGVRHRYSTTLREGLAHTLAKLGAYDNAVDTGNGMTGQLWADLLVGELLNLANSDRTLETWVSMAASLPLLAQASPTAFLRAVRDGLDGDEPLLAGMFRDQKLDPFGLSSHSPHTELLWALERLAWAPEHFDGVVSLLARLAVIDPGGRLANRPQESLASVFCPWRPHTAASEEQRIATIQRLRRNFPGIAWELLLTHLPDSHSIQVDQAGAQYRDWGRDQPTVTRAQYLRVVETAAEILTDWLSDEPERCVELIERADDLPPTQRQALADQLKMLGAPDGPLSPRQGDEAWEALRSLISKHREYADAPWALPETELAPLAEAMDRLTPADPAARHGWLFRDGLVTLGDLRRRDDHEAYEAALAARRHDAVMEIVDDSGLDAVLSFAEEAAVPEYVGAALARASNDEHDGSMLTRLDAPDQPVQRAAFGYVRARFRQAGWAWLDAALSAHPDLSSSAVARALRASHDPTEAAPRAETRGDAVASCYWREFSYIGLGPDFDAVNRVARNLIDVGRPAAALDLLALYQRRRKDDDGEHALLVADAFEALLASPDDEEIHHLSSHEFSVLFAVLAGHRHKVGQVRVIRIEWALAPALGYDPDLRSIYDALATEPELFVELVKLQYRREDDEEPTDEQRRAAENAFRVLAGWKTCPATDPDGHVDPDLLRTWVHHAREQFAEAGLLQVGDLKPRAELVHGRYAYAHPQFDAQAIAAQRRLAEIQGRDRTWFAGAYLGYGFHEDGLQAGLAVAAGLGSPAPWHGEVTPRQLRPPARHGARCLMEATRSALYRGRVRHTRLQPSNEFTYRVYYGLFDIDELDALDAKLRLFSVDRFNVFGFNRTEPTTARPTATRCGRGPRPCWHRPAWTSVVAGSSCWPCPGSWGTSSTRSSVWYCHDEHGTLRAILYEVRNIFGDRHTYVAPVGTGPIHHAVAKAMHVSPFNEMNQTYDFAMSRPGDRLGLTIAVSAQGRGVFQAGMQLSRLPFTDRNLARLFATHPLLTVKVVAGIHWQALRLWLKGAPFHRRPQPPQSDASVAHGPAVAA